jgi:hypothetical protein
VINGYREHTVIVSVPIDQEAFRPPGARDLIDVLELLRPVEGAIKDVVDFAGDEWDGAGFGGGQRDFFMYTDHPTECQARVRAMFADLLPGLRYEISTHPNPAIDAPYPEVDA